LVLVDAAHEDQFSRFKQYGIARHSAGTNFMMSGPKVPENLPDETRAVAQSLVETTDAFLALRGETISFRHSAQQVRDSGSLPNVPTVVITRGKRVWPENEQGDRLESIWRNLQEDLAARASHSGSIIGVSHLFANKSGHYVHLDEPEVVVNVVHDVVEAGRNKLF
jgi:pimeloyl-ACP methyl ester carboxylesterase